MEVRVITLPSLADLPAAAVAVMDFAKENKILLFVGEMAAGKTTLIKEICRLMGVEEPVTSPTYALVNEYAGNAGQIFYHFDFYRLQGLSEAMDMGATEYFESGHTCLVEWPEIILPLLPDHFVTVTIDKGAGEARTLTLKKN